MIYVICENSSMEHLKSQKELLFFIENYTGRNDYIKDMTKPCKHARTYMNRFTICEDDQYEISEIHVMNSNWGIKAGKRPTKIQKIIKSMAALSAANIDIFLFGWYEFRGHLGGTTRRIDIKDTLTKCLRNVNSKIETLRISFMDMNIRRQPSGRASNRIDTQEVKNLYKEQNTYKISLNDQLEAFYEKCRDGQLSGHEIAYYFHAELLPPDEFAACHAKVELKETQKHINEIELLEKKFSLFAAPYRKKLCFAEMDEATQKYKTKVKESRTSEFRLYGGVRATLVFHPKRDLPRADNLKRLSETLSPMLYTQFWRKWDPMNVPKSTSEIEVIGFEREIPHNELFTNLLNHHKIVTELFTDLQLE